MGKNIFFTGVFLFFMGLGAYLFSLLFQDSFSQKLESFSSSSPSSSESVSPEFSSALANNPKLKDPLSETNTQDNKEIEAHFYVNFTCPHCRVFYKKTLASFKKDSEKKNIARNHILWTIHNFPFADRGLDFEMAKFFRCAADQKDDFLVLDYFFFGMDEISEMKNDEWIAGLELNREQMNTCLEKEGDVILAEKKEAQIKGVKGTPTLVFQKSNQKKIFEGNVDRYKIDMGIFSLSEEE